VKNDVPLVSVVIIAYNEEKHISAAIESVLNQTYENIEVIVVNDGSTDSTLATASQYEPRIKLITQKNSGGCSSPRNTGLNCASGQYVAFLDADDILVPEKIHMQIELFLEFKSIGMVIGNYENFRGDEKYQNHFSTCPELLSKFHNSEGKCILFNKGEAAALLISENFSIAGSPLYSRDALLELGGFDESLLACEDFNLIYRMAQRYEVIVDNRVVFHRRLHASNMSSNQLKMLRFYCLSRLGLADQETDFHRKSLLRKRVSAYFKNYVREIIRVRALAQVRPAALIFLRYCIGGFSRC
jgi:glycosyltransferase involved in cell wall biosynthesis